MEVEQKEGEMIRGLTTHRLASLPNVATTPRNQHSFLQKKRKEGEREGGRERGKEGGREREGGKEGGREREGRREGGRERGKKPERDQHKMVQDR